MFEQFTKYTGLKVEIVRDLAIFDPTNKRSESAKGKPVSAIADIKNNVIKLYVAPDANITSDYIMSQMAQNVLFQSISSKGIENLILHRYRADANKQLLMSMSVLETKSLMPLLYSNQTDLMTPTWHAIANALQDANTAEYTRRFYSGLFSLDFPVNAGYSFCVAQRIHASNVSKEIIAHGTLEQKNAETEYQLSAGRIKYLNIGPLSESYRRIGFPEMDMAINNNILTALLNHDNITGEKRKDINHSVYSAITNPLAIILSDRKGDTQIRIITSIRIHKEERYLCFFANSPQKTVAKAVNDPNYRSLLMTPFIGTKEQIHHEILMMAKRADIDNTISNNLLYLNEGSRYGYNILGEIVDNAQKNGTEISAGLSVSISRLLNFVTKIQQNFKNPISSEEYFEKFGKHRDPVADYIAKREEYQRALEAVPKPEETHSIEEISVKDETVFKKNTPGQENNGITKVSIPNKLNLSLRGAKISARQMTLLNKAGINTTGDVIKAGPNRILKVTNPKTLQALETLLHKYNLSMYGRPKAPSIQVFMSMNDKEKAEVMRRDLKVARMYIPSMEEINAMQLYSPMSIDGIKYNDYIGVMLMIKQTSMYKRWNGCPVFLEPHQMAQLGIFPLSTAEATHIPVEQDGKTTYKTYYNISETNFALSRPDLFNKLTAHICRTQPQVSPYYRHMLDAFSLPMDPSVRMQNTDFDLKMLSPQHYAKEISNQEALNKQPFLFKVALGEDYSEVAERAILRWYYPDADKSLVELGETMFDEGVDTGKAAEIIAERKPNKAVKAVSAQSDITIPKELRFYRELPLKTQLNMMGYFSAEDAYRDKHNIKIPGTCSFNEAEIQDFLFSTFRALSETNQKECLDRADAIKDIINSNTPGRYDVSEEKLTVKGLPLVAVNISNDGFLRAIVNDKGEDKYIRTTALDSRDIDTIAKRIRRNNKAVSHPAYREDLETKNKANINRTISTLGEHQPTHGDKHEHKK